MSLAPWFVASGQGPFSVVISSVTEDGTDSGSSGTPITSSIDEVLLRYRNRLENISPLDRRSANYVVGETETVVRLVEILKRKGVNFLAGAGLVGDYVSVVITRGEQKWGFTGVVYEYEECIRRGKCVGILTLYQVDTGTENPSYG